VRTLSFAKMVASLGLQEQFQLPVPALTKSWATSMDTSYINGVLADAIRFRAELAEQHLDDLADDFFENHPDLAESIEELPAYMRCLRPTERL
jgi:hypothetical protein